MEKSRVIQQNASLLTIGGPELLHCHGSCMRLAPVAHRVQQGPQRFSQWSNGVHDPRRCVRVYGTFNDSRAPQITELLGERSLRDSGDSPLQFGKSLGPFEKLLKNGSFPTPTHDACGGLYRTEFWTLRHDRPSPILYTMYRIRATYSYVTTLASSSSILTKAISVLVFSAALVGLQCRSPKPGTKNAARDLGETHATGSNEFIEE